MSHACAARRILIYAKDRRESDFILSRKLHMFLK
jgi:hypothetical protein